MSAVTLGPGWAKLHVGLALKMLLTFQPWSVRTLSCSLSRRATEENSLALGSEDRENRRERKAHRAGQGQASEVTGWVSTSRTPECGTDDAPQGSSLQPGLGSWEMASGVSWVPHPRDL